MIINVLTAAFFMKHTLTQCSGNRREDPVGCFTYSANAVDYGLN